MKPRLKLRDHYTGSMARIARQELRELRRMDSGYVVADLPDAGCRDWQYALISRGSWEARAAVHKLTGDVIVWRRLA